MCSDEDVAICQECMEVKDIEYLLDINPKQEGE